MMRSRVRGLICGALAMAAAAVAVPLGAGACGVLDGVFGAVLLSDEELCDRARALEFQHATDGCVAGAAVLDCPMIECGRSNAVGECAAPWDEFLACLVDDDHECDELGAGAGYCTALFEAFVTCGAAVCDTRCISDDDCSADGGARCSDLNARFCAEAAADLSCAPDGARFAQCRDACKGDSECGGTTPLCVETGVNDGARERACEESRCDNVKTCGAGFVCAHPVTMERDVAGFCLPTCDPIACFGDTPDASCTCNDTVTRCAPLQAGGVDFVGFACTMTGDRVRDGECDAEGDCGNGTACVDGACRGYCDFVSGPPDCSAEGGDDGCVLRVEGDPDVGTCL